MAKFPGSPGDKNYERKFRNRNVAIGRNPHMVSFFNKKLAFRVHEING
jgi:hypothetical protein